MWHWSAEAPTPFEMMLAGHLSAFTDGDSPDQDNGVFRVSAYSWRGDDALTSKVFECIPKDMEVKFPRLVTFHAIDEEMKVSIPSASVFNSSKASFIDIGHRDVTLHPGIMLLVASRQMDYDDEGPTLAGHDDALGIVSLVAGHILNKEEVFSSYFCVERKKFLCGRLRIVEDPVVARTVIPELGEIRLDAQNETTHVAFWFAGKAFSASDHASKIVFYQVALESAVGKQNVTNFFGSLYKGRGAFTDHIMCLIKRAKSARDDIVHRGERRTLTTEVERYIQAAIIDALRDRHGVNSDNFAALTLYRAEKGETHGSTQ